MDTDSNEVKKSIRRIIISYSFTHSKFASIESIHFEHINPQAVKSTNIVMQHTLTTLLIARTTGIAGYFVGKHSWTQEVANEMEARKKNIP